MPVCDGHCVQSGRRLRSRSVPAADCRRSRKIRRQRHLPHRGRANLGRPGAACPVLWVGQRVAAHAECGPGRSDTAICIVFDDAHRIGQLCGAVLVRRDRSSRPIALEDAPTRTRVVGQFESGFVGAGSPIDIRIVFATSVRSWTCLSYSGWATGFGSQGSGFPGAGSSRYLGTRWTWRCGTEFPSS